MTLSLARAQKLRQRALGAYYTPTSAAEYLAAWAIRSGTERVLEPSVGDGAFVAAAHVVGRSLGGRVHVTGVELSPETLAATMASPGAPDVGVLSDFLDVEPEPVDAVIGNPPFVRLRNLEPAQRGVAVRAATEAMGAVPEASGSTWLPFVAHATRFLVRGGRLALVLPVEATHVKYARPLWRFLADSFGSLAVVRVKERIFGGILQDVVLLMADEAGGTCEWVDFFACERVRDLSAALLHPKQVAVADIVAGAKPFTRALLPTPVLDLLAERVDPLTAPAGEAAKFNIGYVTGDKEFFHPSAFAVHQYGVPQSALRPAIASARKLVGGGLGTADLDEAHKSRLFLPGPETPPEAVRKYVRHGEASGVNGRYKCRIRNPWYVVPGVRTPDLILTVFADRPLLLVNDGELAASNSLLCGFTRPGVDPAAFAAAWYSPLTLLGVELSVHSLGGGVLVLVPGEADAVPIVPPARVRLGHLADVDAALRRGDAPAAYEAGAEATRAALGLTAGESDALRDARDLLASWRVPDRRSLEDVEPDVAVLEGLHHPVHESADRQV